MEIVGRKKYIKASRKRLIIKHYRKELRKGTDYAQK
jgi:hypothetical protein